MSRGISSLRPACLRVIHPQEAKGISAAGQCWQHKETEGATLHACNHCLLCPAALLFVLRCLLVLPLPPVHATYVSHTHLVAFSTPSPAEELRLEAKALSGVLKETCFGSLVSVNTKSHWWMHGFPLEFDPATTSSLTQSLYCLGNYIQSSGVES